MKLTDFLKSRDLTDAAFAEVVGLSQSQINRIRRGLSKPSWAAVAAIERATGGAVTWSDFVEERAA